MSRLLHFSIYQKLVGLIAILITLIVVTLTAYFPSRQVAELRRGMERRGEIYGALLAVELQSSVAFRDRETAREVLTSLAVDPDIVASVLLTSDGQELYALGKLSAPVPAGGWASATSYMIVTPDHIVAISPVRSPEGPRGTLVIELATARLNAGQRLVTITAVTVGSGILICGVFLVWLIARSIVGRLRKIVDVATAVTSGQLEQQPIIDGSSDELGVLARAFNDMLSRLRGSIANIHDMALREQDTLARANRTLEERVQERTQQLTLANQQLTGEIAKRNRMEIELRHAQKLESVGRLAAGVAHEINTPIQFVGDNISFLESGAMELLKLCTIYHSACERASVKSLDVEDVALLRAAEDEADIAFLRENLPSSIASMQDGIARVAKIVQAMKYFAHQDQGHMASADLNAALLSTLTIASNELRYVADVKIDLGDLPPVPCFLSDLNQVFLNLLVNAAHAVGDVVAQSAGKGTIQVKTAVEGDHVTVSIMDSGTGIPENIRHRIFDPFFTTKEVGKGTGQGLALAHTIVVEKHHGTLSFDSECGKGTTFHVRLPLAQTSIAALDKAS